MKEQWKVLTAPLTMLALGAERRCNLETQHETCMFQLEEQQFTCDEGRLERDKT